MKNSLTLLLCSLIITVSLNAQNKTSDSNIIGHVLSNNAHIGYVNIAVKGTTLGTVTDETGHYSLTNLPPGEHTLVASCVGYKMEEKTIIININSTQEVNFELEKDVLGLDEVIISSDRNSKKRGNAPIVVNTISHELLSKNQAVTIADGLNFVSGLRMEANCQNCGFTQLRMNGLEGPYSQILINNRPVFSGLAGVYGLELIPANIIERIEVVRGGGSALYGGNAIAGTVNLILKEPVREYFQVGTTAGLTGFANKGSGGAAPDLNVQLSTSVMTNDRKTGITLYAFNRNREAYDANNDEFSELSMIKNTSVGARFFHRMGFRSKLSIDFLNMKEERRGGSDFEVPSHEARISEAVDHSITNGSISYDQFFREEDKLSVYISGQHIIRDSYYGAEYSLSDYGLTHGNTYNSGVQYHSKIGKLSVISGFEYTTDQLYDQKLGYPDYANSFYNGNQLVIPHIPNTVIINQTIQTSGLYTQFDYDYEELCISGGIRFDHYRVRDKNATTETNRLVNTGNVLSPRLSLLYTPDSKLKFRMSYAQGYRAPQVFDEDLHILTSGSRKVHHVNSEDLKQESSNSFTGSFDYNGRIRNLVLEVLLEAFYTRLNNPFSNEISDPDPDGIVTYTRINAVDGAVVKGANFESNFFFTSDFSLNAGFTIQSSMYEQTQEFNERRFLRTPNSHGFVSAEYKAGKKLAFFFSGSYTGKMLVPHYGIDIAYATNAMLEDLESGYIIQDSRLELSDPFFDLGLKMSYLFKINGASLELIGGVKNILNSYQSEFDRGVYRDPGYIYGPMQPRTIYIGLNLGNRLGR